MKKLFIVLFISTLVISCNERIVQLPETTNKEITEILDVSPIYMFYDETKPEGIEFNRKNMISTTNWLVNIDKRLTLKQILPHLQYLQEKRHGDGMHKNESAKNYFSCSNPEIQNLAFIEFTDINYIKSQNSKINSESEIYIKINEDGSVSPDPKMRKSLDSIETYFKSITDYFPPNTEKQLILIFNENLSFENYINIKTQILAIESLPITISNDEFIL